MAGYSGGARAPSGGGLAGRAKRRKKKPVAQGYSSPTVPRYGAKRKVGKGLQARTAARAKALGINVKELKEGGVTGSEARMVRELRRKQKAKRQYNRAARGAGKPTV